MTQKSQAKKKKTKRDFTKQFCIKKQQQKTPSEAARKVKSSGRDWPRETLRGRQTYQEEHRLLAHPFIQEVFPEHLLCAPTENTAQS